jgi:hypothetical protein
VRLLLLAWLVVAISPSAHAGVVATATGEPVGYPTGTGDGVALSVEVGRTTERAVGNANGWFCDDPSLIKAAIVTRGDVNYWVVTGLEVGATQCRVGTDPSRSTVVFDVTVKRASSKRRL